MFTEHVDLVFDLVGRTTAGAEGVAKAYNAVKSAFVSSEAAGDADLKSAIAELAEKVAEAKLANADLRVQLSTLKIALHEAQKRKADFDRYVLWKTPGGGFVYRAKEPRDPDEPAHYLCPNCADQGRKSIIQGRTHDRFCHTCKTPYAF